MRARIVDVAFKLFSAAGFETTTMAQIAHAAGISRRSLFRYFATKEQVALAYQDDLLDILVSRLQERPAVESASAAMIETLLSFVRDLRLEDALSLSDLLVANPSLQGHSLSKYRDIEVAFAQAVTARCQGAVPEREGRIAAACVVGAWRVANETWFDGGRSGHPAEEAVAAFAQLRFMLVDEGPKS